MQQITNEVLQQIAGDVEALLIENQKGIDFAYVKIPDGIKISIGVELTPTSRHHRDGNTANNKTENIIFLCRKCHMKEDGRLEQFIELARKNQPKAIIARWN